MLYCQHQFFPLYSLNELNILISVHFAKIKQGRHVLIAHKDYIVIIRKLKSIEYIYFIMISLVMQIGLVFVHSKDIQSYNKYVKILQLKRPLAKYLQQFDKK